jgi:PleD family two-component response regulator
MVVIDVDIPVDAEAAFRLLCERAGSEAPTTMHADTQTPRLTRRAAVRTMMVVGREPNERVLETVTDAGGYDVIVVEPTATAYSRIKRLAPHLIVLSMAFDDVQACQLLSMLKLDRETSGIPLFTCLLEPAPAQSDV